MARDYKSRAQRKPDKRPIPAVLWLLIGYLLGVVSIGLLWLNWSPDGEVPGWINQDPPLTVEHAAEPARDTEEKRAAPPRFDFYTLLPEMEVVVPEDELEEEPPPRKPPAPVAAASTEKEPAPVQRGPGYLLQVGSFRNARDAESLKAALTLNGYSASISRVTTSDGKTWRRVRVGPITSAEELKAQRRRLESQGYKSLVIRVKP